MSETTRPRPELSAAKQALREARLRGVKVPRADTLAPRPRTGPVPLSFAQERLWFLDRLQPGDTSYNLPSGLRIPGEMDAAVLERAVAEVVRRHEALRTTFPETDGEPVQRIAPFTGFTLPVEDLSGLDDGAREAEVRRRAAEEATTPFDLAAGPLFRARLLRLGDEEHVLLACLHHIVTDGWSNGVLFAEVKALYDSYKNQLPPALPGLPVQYADYALWQREPAQLAAEARQLEYWTRRMAGAPELLPLPTDRPRARTQSMAGASVPVHLPPAVLDGVRALAHAEGATPFMVVLAAFQLLLGRWAATDDVVVGTPVAGRTRRELEGLIGLFVNTVVLRTDLSGDPAFRALVRRVRQDTLNDYANQDLPFERLVAALQPGRGLGHAPLFQVLFQMHGAGGDQPLEDPDGMVEMDTGATAFDLRLFLTADSRGITGRLHYHTELWDADTIRRMAGHFAHLVTDAATHPDRRLSRLELMGAGERARLLDAWNRTDAVYPPACIHHLFEAQAARTPDAAAVVFEAESLTYAQLDARANQLAHYLRGLGVGPEARVGVCAERSMELVVALLGVLKAGGAYVPIDPSYPLERMAYMLADSAVPVLLTQARLADAFPDPGVRVVRLDADWARIAAEPAESPDFDVSPDGLAYVIYTSGSTGRPKGAMNAHRGVVNRLRWMQDAYGLDASDAVLQKTPFSFDVSVWELFWPLMTGARLVMARPGAHGDPAYLASVIEGQGITTLHFVPSMLQAFLDAEVEDRCASLRRVFCSGEALPHETMERALDAFPSAALHNLYGPTEAAVDVTYWPCAPRETRVVPIGRPVANTRVYVLDAAMNPVPIGVAGELHIGGVQVGRGYLRRPALTAAAFVPDPFGAPGARLYRTGDRARWTADGEVEYLGRVDFQVKIRGFRIEPGEVEAALRGHPSVADAVAVVRPDATGDPRLVAYVVPAPGGEAPPAAELRAHVRARLPEHMVPAAVVALDALPLSPNGKLDRKALPAPDAPAASAEYVAPRTDTERVVAGIWCAVLGL
ncbi:MAG TPA: amino acid adenylation domain-containing protein, partial [Longimicrobium sp.]